MRIIFISLIIFCLDANAILIQVVFPKINPPTSSIQADVECSNYYLEELTFHMNGIKYKKIFFRIIKSFSSDEKVTIATDMGKVELPHSIGQRFLSLVAAPSWSELIYLNPDNYPKNKRMHLLNPTCSFINLFLLFDMSVFDGRLINFLATKKSVTKTVDLLQSLTEGSMIIISDETNENDNDSYIYLGNGLFLGWECGIGYFYIRRAEAIDAKSRAKTQIEIIHHASFEGTVKNNITTTEFYPATLKQLENILEYSYIK